MSELPNCIDCPTHRVSPFATALSTKGPTFTSQPMFRVINKKGIRYCQIIRRLVVFIGGAHRPRAHCPNSAPSQLLGHHQQKNGAEESARWRKSLCIFHIIRCRVGRSPPRALQFGRYEYYYNKCPIQSILIHGQHGRPRPPRMGNPAAVK